MQGRVVELIRELMQIQQMSVRKISARIAKEHGGSAMGYTQQINRILNDPDYDPNFSTVQKILAALNFSMWQSVPVAYVENLETRLDQLSQDVSDLKMLLQHLINTQVIAQNYSGSTEQRDRSVNSLKS